LFQFVSLSLVFLSHYPYLNFKIFNLKIIEKKEKERNSLSCPALPSAPAAWAAASGPTSGHSPGVGPPPGRLLASSHGVAAPPSARLIPLVVTIKPRWLMDQTPLVVGSTPLVVGSSRWLLDQPRWLLDLPSRENL
jgi:hypothetical protein